jgi:hypothetical protein
MKLEFSRQIFEKYSNMKFQKTRPVGAESFHADGRTDRHDESKCCISHILRTHINWHLAFLCNILLNSNIQKWLMMLFNFYFCWLQGGTSILFGAVGDARDGSHLLSLGASIPRQGCNQPVSHKICSWYGSTKIILIKQTVAFALCGSLVTKGNNILCLLF